jgi:hypothetical protein
MCGQISERATGPASPSIVVSDVYFAGSECGTDVGFSLHTPVSENASVMTLHEVMPSESEGLQQAIWRTE